LQPAVEEVLYPAMEDFRVDLISAGAGRAIHPFQLPLYLDWRDDARRIDYRALRSRFWHRHRLEFLRAGDLLIIIHRSAKS